MNAKELGQQPVHPASSDHLDPRTMGWTGGGLTKRELFAAMALQGILAATDLNDSGHSEDHADWAVRCADALLDELSKDQP